MPRFARAVVPNCPHHVTQRGNNRQDVFFVPDDYALYLDILREQAARYDLAVHAYCLMTNHVHLVATPHGADSLARAVGRTHWLYSQTINRLHGRSGHVWQGRFYSCALDRAHFRAALKYVERNPVRAKLVRAAWRYPWSSAAAHCGVKDASRLPAVRLEGLLDLGAWGKMLAGEDWRDALSQRDDPDAAAALRSCTSRGRPLGSDSFMSKIEKLMGRRLRPLPVGRPRKRKKNR